MPRVLAILALLCASMVHAQVEGVVIERFPVDPKTSPGAPAGAYTYRLFIDLAEEHTLLSIYGDELQPFRIGTTTTFWNDTTADVRFGEQQRTTDLKKARGWSDSWLAFGFPSDQHKAIPIAQDPDGSILECPDASMAAAHCQTDGMVAAQRIPSTVVLNMELTALAGEGSNVIGTNNGGWAVLGGVKGATRENMVLIAQLTTDGLLDHTINVQLRTPTGEVLRCTAGATSNTEERHTAALRGTFTE